MTWRDRLGKFFDRRPSVQAVNVQRLGAKGSDVQAVQRQLNRIGRKYGIKVSETGVYDEDTRNAVHMFQLEAIGLSSDGFIGPETARRLRLRLIEDPSR